MRILYDNLLESATLSATNEDANYPIEDVTETTLLSLFKADTNSTVITATLAEASTVSCFAIGNHNVNTLSIKLTETDTTTHTYNYTASDLRFSTSITREMLYITAVSDVEEIEYTISTTDITYIGGLSAGQYLQMPYFSVNPQISFRSTGSAQKSDGGVTYNVPGVILEKFSCNFDAASITEYNAINAFGAAVQTYKPYWVDRWESSDNWPVMFAQNIKDVKWTKGPEGIIFDSFSMELEECK